MPHFCPKFFKRIRQKDATNIFLDIYSIFLKKYVDFHAKISPSSFMEYMTVTALFSRNICTIKSVCNDKKHQIWERGCLLRSNFPLFYLSRPNHRVTSQIHYFFFLFFFLFVMIWNKTNLRFDGLKIDPS